MNKTTFQKIPLLLLFTIGGLIFSYPFYSNGINYLVDQYRLKEMNQRSENKIEELKAKMDITNQLITENGIHIEHDPFDANQNEIKKINLKEHLIGTITIPKINMTVPLYDRLTNQILENGAGVLDGTSLPLGRIGSHSVISAHRGLAERELFRDLDQLEYGDVFIIDSLDKALAYEVFDIRTVKPEETNIIKLSNELDIVSLLTCTPYMINSHRLIVTGKRVEVTEMLQKEVKRSKVKMMWQQIGILFGIFLVLILLIWLLFDSIRNHLLRKKLYSFTFYIQDKKHRPLRNKEFFIYQKGKKKPLRRDGKVLVIESNEKGKVIIKDIPGSIYSISLKERPDIFVGKFGIRKLKSTKMTWLKDNKIYVRSENKKKRIVLRLKVKI